MSKPVYLDPNLPVHPNNATCSDCRNWRRCSGFISSLTGAERQCDWHPSAFALDPRFRQPEVTPE